MHKKTKKSGSTRTTTVAASVALMARAEGTMPGSFFFSSRRRHTRYIGDWRSDVCSSDLDVVGQDPRAAGRADPGGLEVVLHRDRHAAQRTVRRRDLFVAHGDEAVQLALEALGLGVEGGEIGRASCRERGWGAGGGGGVER